MLDFRRSAVPAATALKGGEAPDFVLKSLAGANLRLSEYRGEIVTAKAEGGETRGLLSSVLVRPTIQGSASNIAKHDLLGALREGDYSIRGLGASPSSAMAEVMREINDLGTTLRAWSPYLFLVMSA